MKCDVRAPNGNMSRLHGGLYRYYSEAGLNNLDASNYAMADWVRTRTSGFDKAGIVVDPNREPELHYGERPMSELSDNELHQQMATNKTPVYVRVRNSIKEFINAVRANPLSLQYDAEKHPIAPSNDIRELADYMHQRFGVPINSISRQQAADLYTAEGKEYKGQVAFVVKGQAYTVEGQASTGNLIHEVFGHPILELLQQSEPHVYNALISEVMNNEGIKELIRNEYPEEVRSNGTFSEVAKKEAILKALELDAAGKLEQVKAMGFRPFIRRLWEAVKRLLGLDKDILLSSISTIGDLTRILFSDTRIALGGYVPQELYSTMTGALTGKPANAQEMAEQMLRRGNLDGAISFVTDNLGRDMYKDSRNPDKVIKRSSEVVARDFGREDKEPDYVKRAERIATSIFRNQKKDTATDKVTIEGKTKEYTYQQLMYEFLRRGNDARNYGKIGHLFVQAGFDNSPVIIQKIRELSRAKAAPGVPGALISKGYRDPSKTFGWLLHGGENDPEGLGGAINDLKRKLRYEDGAEDAIALTEYIVYDEEWGIGGMVDLAVVYPDMDVGYIDLKFGNIEGGENSEVVTHIMKHMDMESLGAAGDSRFNLGTMNMVLRVVMEKKKNPELRTRYIKIASFKKGATPVTLLPNYDLKHYLKGIEDWVKTYHPDTYEKNKKAGLFEADNYYSDQTLESYKQMQEWQDSPKEDTKALVKDAVRSRAAISSQIIGLSTQLQELKKEGESDYRDTRIRNVSRNMAELATLMLQWNTPRLDAQEITNKYDDLPIKIITDNLNQYDVKIPFLVALKDMRNRQAQIANELKAKRDLVHEQYMADLRREKGTGKFQTGIGAMPYYKGDDTGFWDFMFVEEPLETGEEGTRIRLISKTRDATRYNRLRASEKAYLDYVLPQMEEAYNKSVGTRMILTATGRNITKAKALSLPDRWNPDNAMVYIPYAPQERAEREASASETLKRLGKSVLGAFITDDFDLHALQHAGLPVKFMKLPADMVAGKSHSLNGEHMYRRFMEHMDNLELMEDVYATAKGVDIAMRYIQIHGKYHYKNALDYLENYIIQHIENRRSYSDILAGRWASSDTGKVRATSIIKMLEATKTLTTFSTLSLQPVLAGLNGTLITGINYKVALENILAKKLFGVKNIAFGPKEMAQGYADYVKLQRDIVAGTYQDNKLYHILREWKWTPDNYDFVTHKKDMGYVKSQADPAHLLFMHALVENMGNVSILSAMLHGMKVKAAGKEISVFDAYEVKDELDKPSGKKIKSLVWKAGVRGYLIDESTGTKQKVELTKLTAEEIGNFKKLSAQITGDYRQEERGAAEMNAIWNIVWQFKRYMKRYFKNMFDKPGWDAALGRYIESGETEIDMHTGIQVPILRWEKVYTEGWARTMINGTLCTMLLWNIPGLKRLVKAFGGDASELIKKYRWSNLTDKQKHNVMIGASNFLFLLMSIAAYAGFEDDDSFIATRLKRLIADMEQGGSLTDTLSAWDKPAPAVSKFKNLLQYGTQLMVSTVTQDRTQEGILKGEKNFLRQFGPLGAIEQIEKLSEGK